MKVSKLQQVELLVKYIKQEHTQEECDGFVDGMERTLDFIQNKLNDTK